MRILFGLGNPGEEYAETRHNLGFRVVKRVARAWKTKLTTTGNTRLGVVRRGGFTAALVMPLTYVNGSGAAARRLLDRFGCPPEDLLVVVDDMSLPVGHVRVRARGSDAGHNGLRSIIEALGTEAFPRLRLGIGPPAAGDATEHVLGRFDEEEREPIERALEVAVEAAARWLRANDIQKLMNTYNRRTAGEAGTTPGSEPGAEGES